MNYREEPNMGEVVVSEESQALLNKVTAWLKQTEGADSEAKWLREAEADYAFYAGDQDTPEVLMALAEQKRPPLVYNEVKPKVDVVVGLAGQNRQLPTAFPVEKGDEALVELANGVIKYFRRESTLADNEIGCFEHTVKGGRSLLYFYINDENPYKPLIKTKVIHGRNFKIDPRSVCYDLSDARFVFIDFWFDKEEIQCKYPGFDPTIVTHLQSSDSSSPMFYNSVEDTYRITECWYMEAIEFYWIVNPISGKPEKYDKESFEMIRKKFEEGFELPNGEFIQDSNLQFTKRWGTAYKYVVFSNYIILEQGFSYYLWEGYPCVLFAGYKHDKENRWFGLISMMRDPQKGINTMRRQMQHLLQTAPKGILIHEVGAILDIEAYEQKSAEPNYHMEVSAGGMEKVRFTDQPTISPVYGNLMATDQEFMKNVTGIQNDTLGIQTYSREPGITTQLRQGQHIAILYILLDNFKKSRLQATRLLFSLIQQFITDERIIRIEGQKGQQLLEINSQHNPEVEGFNDISIGEYDFYVEEGIETVNSRNQIAQLLTDMNHQNPGSVPPELIIEYSGAPFTVVQQIREHRAQSAESQMQAAQEEKHFELLMEKTKADSAKYVAIINNVTKLIMSEDKSHMEMAKMLLAQINQQQIAKPKGE